MSIKSIGNSTPISNTYTEGRRKVIRDYIELYIQSAILDYFAKAIRTKFHIPKLRLETDIEIAQVPVDGLGNYIDEERSIWYANLPEDVQDRLEKKIYDILHQLYLPRTAFDMLLMYVLYMEIPKHYPFYDMDLVIDVALGHFPGENEVLGYSKKELEHIQKQATNYLKMKHDETLQSDMPEQEKQKQIKIIDKNIELVPVRCRQLLQLMERKNRPLQDLAMDIKIIQLLQAEYRKKKRVKDHATGEIVSDTVNSKDIVSTMFPELHFKKFDKKAAWYRGRVRDLKKKFPFLEDFMKSSNSSLA